MILYRFYRGVGFASLDINLSAGRYTIFSLLSTAEYPDHQTGMSTGFVEEVG